MATVAGRSAAPAARGGRLRSRGRDPPHGAALGCAFLTKAFFLPFAVLTVTVASLSAGSAGRALRGLGAGLVSFSLLAGPFVIALSGVRGRVTAGDAGKLNYAWFVNGARPYYHWQGEPPGSGRPLHPTRLVLRDPEVFEFGTPVGGTYPPWFDSSYWHEGLKLRFHWRDQLRAVVFGLRNYRDVFCRWQSDWLVGWCVLAALGRWRASLIGFRRDWVVWALTGSALAAYAVVYVEWRFIGPFAPLVWLAGLGALRFASNEVARAANRAAVVIVLLVAGRCILSVATPAWPVWRAWPVRRSAPSPEAEVAEWLRNLGVAPGQRVARIAYLHTPLWARVARVRVVAEVPRTAARRFWAASPHRKSWPCGLYIAPAPPSWWQRDP